MMSFLQYLRCLFILTTIFNYFTVHTVYIAVWYHTYDWYCILLISGQGSSYQGRVAIRAGLLSGQGCYQGSSYQGRALIRPIRAALRHEIE